MIERIFIPTLNRVDKQITLERLPKVLQEKVTLVVQHWERPKYNYDVAYLVLPKNLDTSDYLCLAKTREIIYEEGKYMKYAIIDDDITFTRRNQKRWGNPSNMEKTQRKCNDQDHIDMFNTFSRWLDDPSVTFGGCSHLENIPATKEYKENTSIGSAVWFNGNDFRDILHDLPTTIVKYSEDTLFFLSLLSRGFGNRISTEYAFENKSVHGKINSDVWDESTHKEVWADHKKIEEMFPNFYKVLLDENGERVKGGYRDFGKVRVQWNKCFKSSQQQQQPTLL